MIRFQLILRIQRHCCCCCGGGGGDDGGGVGENFLDGFLEALGVQLGLNSRNAI